MFSIDRQGHTVSPSNAGAVAGVSVQVPARALQRPVTRSNNPPLAPAQIEQARSGALTGQRPAAHSAVEFYEAHVPAFKALRMQAAHLARRQHRADPTLTPLEVARQHMTLQGQLLALNPNLGFAELAPLLNVGNEQALMALIPGGEAFQALENTLRTSFSAPADLHHPPQLSALTQALDEHLSQIAKHIDGHASLYKEVLAKTELNGTERADVQRSQAAFGAVADRWAGNIHEHVLDLCFAVSDSRLDDAQRYLERLDGLPETTPELAQRVAVAKEVVEQWQAVTEHFENASKKFTKEGPIVDALRHLHFEDHVAALNAKNAGFFTHLLAFLNAGTSQGLASMLQFVLARAYVDPNAAISKVDIQSFDQGLTLGAVHETLDNVLKPIARDALAVLGAPDVDRVPPQEVIHNPPRAITENGVYRELAPEELELAQAQVDAAAKEFINAQQDYHNGTMKGDMITFLTQGGAQMGRQAVDLLSQVNAGTVVARLASSFVGGFFMSGWHTTGQLGKKYEHNGVSIPTHVVKDYPTDPVVTIFKDTLSKALTKSDPRKTEVRENYLSKGAAGIEGMYGYNGMRVPIDNMDTSTAAGKAASIILTGIQAVSLLAPFYANKQSGEESKSDKTNRLSSALLNIKEPDRETIPHGTKPGTWARTAENTYNRLRGLMQVAPQATTESAEAIVAAFEPAVKTLSTGVSQQIAAQTARLRRPARNDIEMNNLPANPPNAEPH